MKQRHLWLLALLSILTLMTTTTTFAGDDATSGRVEIGFSGIDTKDSPARVNEYAKTAHKDGLYLTPKLSLRSINENSAFDFNADIRGQLDHEINLDIDAMRIFKLKLDYQAMEHWKDHETLDQMGATLAGDSGGGQPNVTTDKIWADLYDLPTPITTVGGQDPIAGTYDPKTAYTQELNNEYIVTRREFETDTALTLPILPNITFHAGIRVETRDGMEQAIGLSKCAGCHVSAEGKEIDERTQDLSFGITGKFGIATIEYDYLNRTFEENADVVSRWYSNNDKFNQLLYEGAELDYANTPDSDKDSHSLKLRLDLPSNTVFTSSYVKSNIESDKSDLSNSGYTLQSDTLETEYESFGAKLSTVFGQNWRFALRGSVYEIDVDSNVLTFADRQAYINSTNAGAPGYPSNPADSVIVAMGVDDDYSSAEEREVTELGFDAVYRLAKGTTLRLGYEFEEIKREEAELGETETHTFKAALKSRINKQFSGRISYQYQDISDPFAGDDATGIYQGTGTQDPLGSGLWYQDLTTDSSTSVFYWDVVYPERTLEATNQPDAVHEAKLSTTWAPRTNMAATFFARVRYEENDGVEYQQTTYVPGMSIWYAPNNKLNLTMAYTFSKQDTENRACVGWYHG